MSAYSRPVKSAPPKATIPAPTRPTVPYISLDDPHTQNFFTKQHVHNYLRRAGLLNKDGEILTQAEYESKQTDVAIGRENQRKIDDAITEVLQGMAKEHWAHARNYTENVEKDLRKEFARIERQYRRRTQPITIRHSSDGRVRLDSTKPSTDHQSDVSENSLRSSTTPLPAIPPVNPPPHSRPSDRFATPQSPDLEKIRRELNNLKNKLENLEKKLNTDLGKDKGHDDLQSVKQSIATLREQQIIIKEELRILNGRRREEKPHASEFHDRFIPRDDQTKSSEIDKEQIEHLIQISTVIKELRDRILNHETSLRNLPTGLTQEAIDRAIQISEKKTMDRELDIENLVHGTNDKIKQMETQLAQLLAKIESHPSSVTYVVPRELIVNEIQNFLQTHGYNNEGQNLAREAINRVNNIENQLNQFFQSNKDNIPQSAIRELAERLNEFEHRLNNISLSSNVSPTKQSPVAPANYPPNMNDPRIAALEDQIKNNVGHLQSLQGHIADLDGRKFERKEIPQILSDIEQKSEQQRQILLNTIMDQLQKKADYETLEQLIQKSKEQTTQQIKVLEQFSKANQYALNNLVNDLNDLRRRLNQQPTTTSTSKVENQLKPARDLIIDKPTANELQAIMPFIELLPTFDMFNENEWI